MEINREKIRAEFSSYVSAYDVSDPKIALKILHTEHVADLCDTISDSLHLGEEEKNIAWVCGMLHDIGRFEQVRRYGTFFDRKSVNHAAFGADLLFKEGLIRQFLEDTSEDPLIERTIRLHTVYALPETLSDRERMFCHILRDADKIDIMRVNCETPLPEIYNLPEEDFRTSAISDAVFADAMRGLNVNREHSKTAADYVVGHICFVYGLVYPESVRQVSRQGYLRKMLHFASDNPKTAKRFAEIGASVESYLAGFQNQNKESSL